MKISKNDKNDIIRFICNADNKQLIRKLKKFKIFSTQVAFLKNDRNYRNHLVRFKLKYPAGEYPKVADDYIDCLSSILNIVNS